MRAVTAKLRTGLAYLFPAVLVVGLVAAASIGAAAAPRRVPITNATVAHTHTSATAVRASSSAAMHPAKNAIDGDFSTGWQARGSHGWLQIDLGRLRTVTAVQQSFARESVWRFGVQASVDGRNWATLLDRSAGAAGQTFGDDVNGVWRYLRLVVTGSASGAPASSIDFSAQANDDGADLALGKPATASSAADIFEAAKAVDDDTSTYWGATGPTMPQWLQVDLQRPSLLTRVVQNFKDDDTYRFRVDGSTDGSAWTTLLDATDGDTGAQFSRKVDAVYRYVRLTVLGSESGFWAGSTEFGVYGFADVPLGARAQTSTATDDNSATAAVDGDGSKYWSATGTAGPQVAAAPTGSPARTRELTGYGVPIDRNLAIGVSATSSSMASGHPPTLADDSQDGTSWQASDTTGPQWLTLDLGNTSLISGIRQTFASSGDWEFRVEASADKVHWRRLLDHRGGPAGQAFSAPVNHGRFRYIRLIVLAGPTASSRELQVFGTGSPETDRWWENTSGIRKYYVNYYHDTLNDIRSDLDTLKSEGYGAIELTTLPSGWPEPFAGLAALNEFQVDPDAGTMADFERLISAAHARGLRVLFFGNLGYPSDHAAFFRQAARDYRNHVDSDVRSWFIFNPAGDPSSCTGAGDRWHWSDVADVCYYAVWGEGAPSFNFASASWRAEARRYLRFWMDTGIDGMVLDASYGYVSAEAGEHPQLIDTPTHNATITDILQNYDALTQAEGTRCCNYGFDDPIVNRHYNAVEWYPEASVLTDHDPDGLENFAKAERDPAVAAHGVALQPPSWDTNPFGSPAQRLLEIANITTLGTIVYLDRNGIDLTHLPQTDIIPTWPAADQESLWSLLRAQNSYRALAPVGSRIKLPTQDNTKYYAYLRASKQGGTKGLVLLNYQDSPQAITVDLTGAGISLDQTPIDLVHGTPAAAISSTKYTVTLPAYGFAVLGVH